MPDSRQSPGEDGEDRAGQRPDRTQAWHPVRAVSDARLYLAIPCRRHRVHKGRARVLLEALEHLFDHDRSASRGEDVPIRGLFLFEHDLKLGNASAHKVLGRVTVGSVKKLAISDYDTAPYRTGRWRVSLCPESLAGAPYEHGHLHLRNPTTMRCRISGLQHLAFCPPSVAADPSGAGMGGECSHRRRTTAARARRPARREPSCRRSHSARDVAAVGETAV